MAKPVSVRASTPAVFVILLVGPVWRRLRPPLIIGV
jgi:hypothetical protein